MICYLIFSVLIAAAAFTVRRRSLLRLTGAAFYAVQAAFAVRIVAGGLYGETSAVWFAFDAAGTLFYCLLCIVSAFAFFHSKASLHDCDLRQTRTYAGLLMLLTTAIAGAYFASNLAVTWIFLEATTLCSAGIIYHRRTAQALEAAWKYVFVCSTGIAMAYLGILLLGLGSMLLSELLGLSDLVLRFLKLCGELIDLLLLTLSHDHLLLGRCQLTGQVLGLCAERVTLVLHGGKLLAKVGLTGRFGCLGGELIDLRGQTIDLPLELLVLGRQRTIAFLCLGKLGGRGLSGLSGLVSRTSCLLGGGLQRRVLLLQGLDLSIQLGNLGIESCDIRAKRLRGLSASNCLLAKGFHRLGYLIEEVIDFIDVIAFLEPYGLESMLPNIFRRQQSHKSLHLALGLMPYCCCFQCSTLARNHRYFAEKRFFRGAK